MEPSCNLLVNNYFRGTPEITRKLGLGWLLERAKRRELAEELARWLTPQKPTKTPPDVSALAAGGRKDPRWQVIVNAEPQSEA